jgi:hypothetical protein
MTKTTTASTHEDFIRRVRDLVLAEAELTEDEATKLAHAKLVYGIGSGAYRGVCHFEAWQNGVGLVDVIEIAATGEENWVQLASTTVHELAHVLAGHGAGHDVAWKDITIRLGFTKRLTVGQHYHLAQIKPRLRTRIAELAQEMVDGSPAFRTSAVWGLAGLLAAPRPCSAGVGTKGGRSRGKGSGSRMVKATCGCGRIIRGSRTVLDGPAITCGECGLNFKIEEGS